MRNRILDRLRRRSSRALRHTVHDLVRAPISGGLHHHSAKTSIALAVIGERVGASVIHLYDRIVAAPSAALAYRLFEQFGRAGRASTIGGCHWQPASDCARDADMRAALEEYASWRTAIVAKVEGDAAVGRAAYANGNAASVADVVIALFTGALTLGKADQTSAALRSATRHLRAWMAADL